MPTIHDLKQSRFLTKEDCGKGILLTIKGWHQDNVAMQGEPEKLKYILDFVEDVKPMTLNTVNGDIIAEMTGHEDFDGWLGHKIVAFNDPTVMYNGKRGGIRVRAPRNIAPAPKPSPPKPAPAPRPPEPEPQPAGDVPPEEDDVSF